MSQRRIRVERPADCIFSEPHARRAVDFFEKFLIHTNGEWTNEPFILTPWQKHDIREIFGRVNEFGRRVVRMVYKRVPKKNGKTDEAAGIALKLTVADSEPGAEVYGVSNDRDQSAIIYRVAAAMVRGNPRLHQRCKPLDSSRQITVRGTNSFYRAVSSDVAGKHGFNSHGVIFDEIHGQRDFRLWEAMTFGAGAARRQPLIYGITTAGIRGESPLAEMLDETAEQVLTGVIPCPPSFYPVVYAAPDNADWHDEEVWRACNPALGSEAEIAARRAFLRIETIRDEYERALRSGTEQNSFRRFRLNQWVAQDHRWIDLDAWDRGGVLYGGDLRRAWDGWLRTEIAELKSATWYGGLDLSTRLDITAFVLVCRDQCDNWHFLPWFWLPEDTVRKSRNAVETEKYQAWAREGLLIATEGNAVDYHKVRERIVEIGREINIKQIGFDPAFSSETAQELMRAGFTMIQMQQGYKAFSEPCQELESAVNSGRVRHGGHPILRWMIDCVSIRQDAANRVRPVKPDRLKSTKRIDGVVAALMGMNRVMFDEAPMSTVSAYSDPAQVVI